MTNSTTIFARLIDGNYRLYNDDGTVVDRMPPSDGWPILWPLESTVSAGVEHTGGIVLDAAEFEKIADRVPLE